MVQQCHGTRETSSGKLGPREIIDHRRNWPQLANDLLCKGHGLQGQDKDKVAPKTSKGWAVGRRQWVQQQCNKGIRKQDRKKLQLESTGNVIKTYRKATGLEMTKQIARPTVRLCQIRNWTLWRG
jgi:hypothetical protein